MMALFPKATKAVNVRHVPISLKVLGWRNSIALMNCGSTDPYFARGITLSKVSLGPEFHHTKVITKLSSLAGKVRLLN